VYFQSHTSIHADAPTFYHIREQVHIRWGLHAWMSDESWLMHLTVGSIVCPGARRSMHHENIRWMLGCRRGLLVAEGAPGSMVWSGDGRAEDSCGHCEHTVCLMQNHYDDSNPSVSEYVTLAICFLISRLWFLLCLPWLTDRHLKIDLTLMLMLRP
jgi:hypothetical protein